MNTGPSPVQQIFSLIEELAYLIKEPLRGIEPGFLSLETLADEVRIRLNGVILEAKVVLDRNMGPLNEFSNALALYRLPGAYPTPLEVQDLLQRALRYMDTSEVSAAPKITASQKDSYVHAARLAVLRQVAKESTQWDLSRLIRLCEELNIAHHNECTMSVGMLLRAIKDHCPPVFGRQNFTEVANNAPGISQSRRSLLKKLDKSLTDIADGFLHEHIRRHESLPTPTQVSFAAELDALLAEIVVSIKGGGKSA